MKNEDLIIKLHKKAFTVNDIVLYLNVKAHYVKKVLQNHNLPTQVSTETKQYWINQYVTQLKNHPDLKNITKGYYSKLAFASKHEIPVSLMNKIFTVLTGNSLYWQQISAKYAAIQKNKELYAEITQAIQTIPELNCFKSVLNTDIFIQRANISRLINSDVSKLYSTFKMYNNEPDTYPNGLIQSKLNVTVSRSQAKQLENQDLIIIQACNISQIELKFEQFFDKLGVFYTRNNRSIITGPNDERWELDFYLPDYQIGIEINPSYTHNSNHIRKNKYGTTKAKDYHFNKYVSARDQNIRLIQLFEYDLYGKNLEKFTFPKLKSILNIDTTFVHTNNVIIEPCHNPKVIKKFLKQNQAKTDVTGDCTYILKLATTNEVIGMFELSYLHNNTWKLLNVLVKQNYWIDGYLDKILDYINQLPFNIKQLLTYTDNNWTCGNKFKQTGWKFIHETGPNVKFVSPDNPIDFYTDKDIPIKILNDDTFLNAIETELNHQLDNKKGYDIIYTCGYKLWSCQLKSH